MDVDKKLFLFFVIFLIIFSFWMFFSYFVLDWNIGFPMVSVSIFSGLVFGLIFMAGPNKAKRK